MTFNKDVFKWWSINATVSGFYAEYTGVVNNTFKIVRLHGYSVSANGQFDIGKGWKSEFYVNYYSAGRRDINESFKGHAYMEFGASKKVSEKLIARSVCQRSF